MHANMHNLTECSNTPGQMPLLPATSNMLACAAHGEAIALCEVNLVA